MNQALSIKPLEVLMEKYNHLFVAIDPDNQDQPALSRALDIAKKSQTPATLTLFLAVYDLSYEMTSMLSGDDQDEMRTGVLHQQEKWLKSILTEYDTENVILDFHVVWHKRPYECMISKIFEGHYDLLIKSTHKHAKLGSILFTPTDWQLIRKCPCPVLLVKNKGWPSHGKILAAVNVAYENEVHEHFNDKLINEAKAMGGFLNSQINLVNAYPATPVNVTIELPEFDPASYTDAVRGHHLLSMKALRQKHGIDEEQTFCVEGLPEDVIPLVAKDINAELVIIGSTGRVGLSAMFIGNTAEHTIDSLQCDLLAIKPDGYVSPLAPTDALD